MWDIHNAICTSCRNQFGIKGSPMPALLKKDALREERDPRRKGHSEGGKHFFNTFLKKHSLREERDPRRKGHSEGGKQSFKYTSQKWCARRPCVLCFQGPPLCVMLSGTSLGPVKQLSRSEFVEGQVTQVWARDKSGPGTIVYAFRDKAWPGTTRERICGGCHGPWMSSEQLFDYSKPRKKSKHSKKSLAEIAKTLWKNQKN